MLKNLKSVVVNKEVSLGRVAGPFDVPPMLNLRISPIGLVPKATPGDFRLIHHLSYPEGESVNDFIDQKVCSVQYAKFDDAVSMIQHLGNGALLAKADIKSAFRLLIVSPGDFELLGFRLDNKYYYDKCLPMGCKISCALFEKFASFLEWVVSYRARNENTTHYLDDFLFGGAAESTGCQNLLDTFHQVCSELGVPIASEKTVFPTTSLIYLGLKLDTTAMTMISVPEEKVVRTKHRIDELSSRKKVRLTEMQSLIGLLNFLCKAIAPGRAFLRRMITKTCGLKKTSQNQNNKDNKGRFGCVEAVFGSFQWSICYEVTMVGVKYKFTTLHR